MNKYSYIILDVEASKLPIINPWMKGSYLSSVGIKTSDGETKVWFFNPLVGDDSQHVKEIQSYLWQAAEVVGHNLKFDLEWLLHANLTVTAPVWCTQCASYLIHGQRQVGHSLNAVAARYGFGSKLDYMKEEFWDKGIDTADIPIDLHEKYLIQDLELTEQVYLKQKKLIQKAKLEKVAELTFNLSKVLAQVEYDGAPFSREAANTYLVDSIAEMEILEKILKEKAEVNFDFNPNSAPQLRTVLYGGEIKLSKAGTESYEVILKGGVKKTRTRKCDLLINVKGLGFKCPEGARTKAGADSTGQDVLKILTPRNKRQREFLDALIRYKSISKMRSTLMSGKKDGGG